MSRRYFRKRLNRRGNPRASLWSASEDRYLAENYPHTTAQAISNKLGRTKCAVRARVGKLSLQKQKQVWWTEQEIATLKRLYPKQGSIPLARLLNRSLFSVQQKVGEQNLHYDVNRWKAKELEFVRKHYHSHSAEYIAKHVGHKPANIRQRAFAMGIAPTQPPKWTEAEMRTMKSMYPKFGTKATAEKLGRSRNAVMLKAQHMNLESNRRLWGPADEVYLRANFKTRTRIQIANDLGMSDSLVQLKALEFGLEAYTPTGYHAWQREFVLKNYKTMTYAAIGKKIGKRAVSVYGFLYGRGLAKSKLYVMTKRDNAYLAKWYGKKSNEEIAKHIGFSVGALQYAVYKRGLKVRRKTLSGL